MHQSDVIRDHCSIASKGGGVRAREEATSRNQHPRALIDMCRMIEHSRHADARDHRLGEVGVEETVAADEEGVHPGRIVKGDRWLEADQG